MVAIRSSVAEHGVAYTQRHVVRGGEPILFLDSQLEYEMAGTGTRRVVQGDLQGTFSRAACGSGIAGDPSSPQNTKYWCDFRICLQCESGLESEDFEAALEIALGRWAPRGDPDPAEIQTPLNPKICSGTFRAPAPLGRYYYPAFCFFFFWGGH